MPYLLDNPNPNKKQYRESRRADPTGAIVIHTTESVPDLLLPDHGAENVARWIAQRDTYGSYHDLVDSDSIVDMAPYSYETWGVGTRHPNGSGLRANSLAVHVSVACQAHQWPDLPADWVRGAITRLAIVCGRIADWFWVKHGIVVPAEMITADQFWDREPGFIYHSMLDPGRRSDPGDAFPRERFIQEYLVVTGAEQPSTGEDEIVLTQEWEENLIAIQDDLREWGYEGSLDAKFGPLTMAAYARRTAHHDAAVEANAIQTMIINQARQTTNALLDHLGPVE